MYKYILFDLDGTLTDPARGITNSVTYALNKFGIDVADKTELYKFIGPPLTDSFEKYYGFSSDEAITAVEYYREYFKPKGIYENEIYQGVPELLKALKENGKTVILATSKPEIFAIEILKYFKLDSYFDFVAGATLDKSRTKKGDVIAYALNSCNTQLKSNSKGDTLYSLFNQYGKMVAFAVGYHLRDSEFRAEEHFDVYTSDTIWKLKKGNVANQNGWELLEKTSNIFGKIPVIYYHHEVDWDGAQPNIERLEWVTSKNGDTNEYFGNPYLVISPDIADERLADAREVGKVMVTDSDGRFEFVAPPDCGDMINNEKNDLNASIERDTLTPDWTYKSISGLGTLSSKAMRQINISGYVKRNRLAIKVYNELIRREINLVVAILCNYEYLGDSTVQEGLKKLKIKFSYQDPFVGGLDDNSTEIATFVGANAMSIHSAVMANPYIEDKEAEEERIWQEIERKAMIDAKVAAASANQKKDSSEVTKEDEKKG